MTTRGTATARHGAPNGGFAIFRSGVIGLARAATLGFSSAAAAPLGLRHVAATEEEPEETGAGRGLLLTISMALVLLGGAFAGLTIALMGQDSIYLQVLAGDPHEPQAKNAKRVYNLLKRGKHWVLVTLLLSNVIVNETLPVVLDRGLGGGVAAVVGSTVLIVIFGEVVPQSICVRYGLQIGGVMSKPVLAMMWLMAPVAWPTAKLLDWALGEDHGTVYKKSGLKTLVTLHKSLGDVGERLNQDEVTIISAVLDLKAKPVENVMTPMSDVFTMSEDTVLDEETMDRILSEGYSRIPIHAPGRPTDFVGMLLVKILITYDPEDACKVRDFPLATLPETRPETSCLDIVNFFQEGKSHMVLVSDAPGDDTGALGVVTLEDVIEELIGEEIIDESDVYIDVHKAIRRLTPAPKARVLRRDSQELPRKSAENGKLIDIDDGRPPPNRRVSSIDNETEAANMAASPGKKATFLMRRSSAGPDGRMQNNAVPVKANLEELRRQLKHLGPSNRNTNPRDTKSTTVKIKSVHGHSAQVVSSPTGLRPASVAGEPLEARLEEDFRDDDDNEDSPLLKPMISGKGGAHAVRKSYGGANPSEAQSRLAHPPPMDTDDSAIISDAAGDTELRMPSIGEFPSTSALVPETENNNNNNQATSSRTDVSVVMPTGNTSSQGSVVSVADDGSSTPRRRNVVRSGSISENVVETSTGVRKIIIEAASSDSDTGGSGSGSGSSRKKKRMNVTEAARMAGDQEEVPSPVTEREAVTDAQFTAAADAEAAAAASSGTNPNDGTGAPVVGKKKKNNKKKKKGKF